MRHKGNKGYLKVRVIVAVARKGSRAQTHNQEQGNTGHTTWALTNAWSQSDATMSDGLVVESHLIRQECDAEIVIRITTNIGFKMVDFVEPS